MQQVPHQTIPKLQAPTALAHRYLPYIWYAARDLSNEKEVWIPY
jgi:hypothetical protein